MDTSTLEPFSPSAPRLSEGVINRTDPSRGDADSVSLASLVHHACFVAHDLRLEEVHRLFTERGVEYMAIVREGRVVGVCSRLRLGMLLGARYGFSLYARSPADLARSEQPLIVATAVPVREVLNRALARAGQAFHEDVALVDDNGALVGLIPIDALAGLQTRLVAEQVAELHQHRVRQEKQAMLDTLVGGIAHELNNKLTPVQGFAELIATTADEETRRHAQLIMKSTTEAAHIIQQLLQLSKPSRLIAETIDLRAIVAEAMTMLRFQVREARCTVRQVQPETPVWVRADIGQLKQVVMNLALNALHAMSERAHAVLEIEIAGDERGARLVVADNGIGIAPEHLGRIFDPFFTTKGPQRGSGLGLSVCASIVRNHGGEIAVLSDPGAGARFTVKLPVDRAPAVRVDLPATTAGFNPAAAAALSERRVLVVEDEPAVRRLIQSVVTGRFGCDVDIAANGVEAFERLATHRYALVISDIRMPAMNGTELFLWLREAQPRSAQRFVFVTGYPGENHLGQDLSDWRIPVLTKPFTLTQLCEVCAPFLAAAEPALAPDTRVNTLRIESISCFVQEEKRQRRSIK